MVCTDIQTTNNELIKTELHLIKELLLLQLCDSHLILILFIMWKLIIQFIFLQDLSMGGIMMLGLCVPFVMSEFFKLLS
jgi:hypothetical protein